MYRNVIVPLEPSGEPDAAIAPAAVLARQFGARLQFLTVVALDDDGLKPRLRLTELAERHNVDASIRVLHADDVTSALLDAADHADTLLCMETRARRPVGELVLGSVSESVVRESRRPVLLVGPHCGPAPERFESIVVGVDGSRLAETILPTVAEWAERLDATPWLFQVLPISTPMDFGLDDVQETAYVHRLAERLVRRGVAADWDVARDRHVAAAIVRFATTCSSPLIALTTHGRSGVSRLALGSVAMAVTRLATVPVLVVRPDTP
jgi:nucleotide-binding universal stress UspA family protein